MKSILVYTVHKAASMFLHRLNVRAAREYAIDYHSINFRRDMKSIRSTSWRDFISSEGRRGCFGPIRAGASEPIFPADVSAYRVILHLRDPRDALTSLFYSAVYSHPRIAGVFDPRDGDRAAWKRAGIDAFVLARAGQVLQRYESLCDRLLGRENVQLVTYERLVTDFPAWLSRYLSAFDHLQPRPRGLLGLVPRASSHGRIEQRLRRRFGHEFETCAENFRSHKRQVTPGDHRRKLEPATIAKLDRVFDEILRRLDYRGEEAGAPGDS